MVILVDTSDDPDPTQRRRFFLALPSTLRVTCSGQLRTDLQGILGEEHVRFHSAPAKKNGRNAPPRRAAVTIG